MNARDRFSRACRVVPYLVARQYILLVAALAVWAAAPLLLGWHAVTVVSGSMMPHIGTGDVLVYSRVPAQQIVRGNVIVAEDPARPGTLLSHRVAWVTEDGNFVTRGDANASNDSTPMPAANVKGVARLRVPWLGMPLVWLRHGRYPAAAIIVLLTLAAGHRVASGRPPELAAGRLRRTRGAWAEAATRSSTVLSWSDVPPVPAVPVPAAPPAPAVPPTATAELRTRPTSAALDGEPTWPAVERRRRPRVLTAPAPMVECPWPTSRPHR